MFKSGSIALFISICLWIPMLWGQDVQTILRLDQDVSSVPGLNFDYHGQTKISQEEAQRLLAQAARGHQRQAVEASHASTAGVNCPQGGRSRRAASGQLW